MSSLPDTHAFARVVRALQPYLGELVVVGGWAHRLYQLHEKGRPPGFEPLMTDDADIAGPQRLAKKAESIATLLKREGFEEELFGEDKPPVNLYHLGTEADAFYVEFLVPLTGSGYRRDGSRDATTIIAGVTAQKLRHIDILVMRPWRVCLSDQTGFPLGRDGIEVQIANPVSYLAQKLLIMPERPFDKQAKDTLYVHDTLRILADSLEDLATLWSTISRELHPNVRTKIDGRRMELFSAVTDRARQASVIAAATGRTESPSGEQIVTTCRLGLQQIFTG